MPALLDGISFPETSELLGDKAYDSNAVRSSLASRGIIATIPPKSNRVAPIFYDAHSYKARHLAENGFVDVKQFRGIATRYCKLAAMYEGLLCLVAWFSGTRSTRRGPSPYQRRAELDGDDGQLRMVLAA